MNFRSSPRLRIISGNHSAQHRWESADTLYLVIFAHLLFGHGHVGRAEITVPSDELRDAAAGSDGLIVDLDVGMELVKLLEPLLINWRRKCGPGGVDGFGGRAGACRENREDCR